ncbi:MAG: hypothetical protein ACRDTS_09595, partial [Mycobacterium sp.]
GYQELCAGSKVSTMSTDDASILSSKSGGWGPSARKLLRIAARASGLSYWMYSTNLRSSVLL